MTAVLPILALLAGSSQTPILFEDFEGGFPPMWELTHGGPPVQWHVGATSECSGVTRMAAYNAGSPACDYAAGGAMFGTLSSSLFDGQRTLLLEFDYLLDIDSEGDSVGVAVQSIGILGNTTLPIAFTDDFINDGNPHSAVMEVPILGIFGPEPLRVQFSVVSDDVGNTGCGWMIDNVRITQITPSRFCFGEVGASCPCGNAGGVGEGCANSTGAGAILAWNGSAALVNDELTLISQGLPATAPILFFQGSSALGGGLGVPFGDGLRCAGGTAVRLGTKVADQGNATFPEAGDPSISQQGGATPNATLYYQAWYRNNAGPCGFGFNLTAAVEVTWY